MLIVCISDKNYFPYACAFMASVLRTNPSYSIHYHLINGTQEQIASLEDKSRITLGTEDIHFNSTEELKRHIINVRFRIMLKLLEEGHPEICYSDVDMIVRKPLDPIQSLCRGSNLGIWMRHDLSWPKKESIFNAALIWASNSPETVAFLKKVDRRSVELMQKHDWFTDQFALYEIYSEDPKAISITPLPRTVNDDQLKWKSFIWAGKWSCDQVQPAYAVEEAYHLKLFNTGEAPYPRIWVGFRILILKLGYPLSAPFRAKVLGRLKKLK